MSTPVVLEVGAALAAIVAVWFALLGWKLVPGGPTRRAPR